MGDPVTLDLATRCGLIEARARQRPYSDNSYAVISGSAYRRSGVEGRVLWSISRTAHRARTRLCSHARSCSTMLAECAGVSRLSLATARYMSCALRTTVPRANIEEQRAMGIIGHRIRELNGRFSLPLRATPRWADVFALIQIETLGIRRRHRLACRDRAGEHRLCGRHAFPGSHGHRDLSGGDEAAIMRSLSKLAKMLWPDTVCLTGHGDSTTMARELMQNPFMQM